MGKSNIVLMGMPASGKSTIGVLLAKALSMNFVDTDLLIQARSGGRLQAIQHRLGMEAFQKLECDTVASLKNENTVIAPGGSAVYCTRAMGNLRENGLIVFLDVPLADIERRVGNMASRGVVIKAGMTLADLYNERVPRYREQADVVIDCAGKSPDALVAELVALR